MNVVATQINTYPEYACIQVKATDTVIRPPVHLCVILDTSASMDADNKLENVRNSIKFMLDFLGPNDKLSIVTFSQNAKIVVNQTSITPSEKENVNTCISLIKSETNTNLSAGIITCQDCLLNDSAYKQGILLLTDGHTNVGLRDTADITKLSSNLVKLFPGTSISCIGYGTDHNAELLQGISSEGGATYYVVNDIEDVAQVFGDVLGGLLTCVAQKVTISLPDNTEVKTRYAVHRALNKTEVMIGDMPSGMEASIIAKVGIGQAVNVKGYDLRTHENFAILSSVGQNNDESVQSQCEAHYIRFIVLDLIEKSRKLLLGSDLPMDEYKKILEGVISEIDKCCEWIQAFKTVKVNALWDILLEELRECNTNLQNYIKGAKRQESHSSAQVMAQRTTYLGRMKGIAARCISTPHDGLYRKFSNPAQNQLSQHLQNTLSPCVRFDSQNDIIYPSDFSAQSQLPIPPDVTQIGRQIAICNESDRTPLN